MADTSLLASFLADRDVPCPGCGYNLRGLLGSRCPECGEAIELDVRRESAATVWRRWAVPGLAWPLVFALNQGAHLLAFTLGPRAPSFPGLLQAVVSIWAWWVWIAGLVAFAAMIGVLAAARWRHRRAQRTWLLVLWGLVGSYASVSLLYPLVWIL
jgi:hypothetical protein